ncbi:hypothetical protein [Streptomyces sp. NPDC007088]|uniref:hypothetical protein n=1 Tax=Streptomyces sp. NPDC007088 TaxID=3364773 RepID=UPI003696A00C
MTLIRTAGFYEELDPDRSVPHDGPIRDAVREHGEPDEARVLAYLYEGTELFSWMGGAPDVLREDDGGPVLLGGSSLCGDGTWVWRRDLTYYLPAYHLALPPDFLAHVRGADYRPPPVSEERGREILAAFGLQ